MISLLDNLNIREQELISKVVSLNGSMESKDAQINELGIPQAYKSIHSEYSNISNSIEALKRAIFIQWYAVAEPITYTGIGSLDKEHEQMNLTRLNKLVLEKNLDKEFFNMLIYYYSITDWYFNSFINIPELSRFFIENENSIVDFYSISNFNTRGQMGAYWSSLNKH